MIRTIPTGFPSLDDFLFLKEGEAELVIVGARPSIGKSAFMFQLALNVSRTMPVLIFSLEMTSKSILRRLIAGEQNKSVEAIQKGLIPRDVLSKSKQKLDSLKYYIFDAGRCNVHQLSNIARDAAAKYGIKLIVVDYIQIIGTEKGSAKTYEIAEITKELKILAKDLNIPVIAAAQLNRQCEARGVSSGDYTPMLADLKDSGSIEQDADIVALLNRPYARTGERPGEADIIIAKNRNGKCGTVTMGFAEAQTKFYDLGVEL